MYSLAVGAFASAAIGSLFSQCQTVFRTPERASSAIQYVFITTTMPTSNASQLNPGTSRGAAANMATAKAILTNSQPISAAMAAAAELRGRLGNFGAFAERFAGYDPAFAEYPAFERLLEKLAAPACPGCRAAGPNGCLHSSCAVRPCARDKNVDFCFQCGDFPCDRHGFPPPLAERWRRNNDRMNAVGPDAFAEEVRHTPRY